MIKNRPIILCFAVATLMLTLVGCGPDSAPTSIDADLDDSTIKIERARLVLTEAPADAKTPTEAKETATEPTPMVLAGRIDAGDIDPFQNGKASFMLSQLPDEGHGADDPDHADNCPFCKRKLKNAPKAIVEFADADGKLLDLDAQELFNISQGDAVIVRGTAHYQDAINTIKFQADGLYKK